MKYEYFTEEATHMVLLIINHTLNSVKVKIEII